MDIIKALFPNNIIVYGMAIKANDYDISSEELNYCKDMPYLRAKEFIAGRFCCKKALESIGVNKQPILRSNEGLPIWPEGICGSITHSQEYCAVAIGSQDEVKSIGIDCEIITFMNAFEKKVICTEIELQWLENLSENSDHVTSLFFSAKESVFKCQYQITGKWLDFQDVDVFIDFENNSFQVETTDTTVQAVVPNVFEGKFIIFDNHVFTGIII